MQKSQDKSADIDVIESLIEQYFQGLHNGDTDLLKSIFHHDVFLKAPGNRRSMDQWLSDVTTREAPIKQGRLFDFKVLAIDIVKDQAMVKVQCPLFDFNYVDFLGLLKEQGRWLIVSKMYIDISQQML